MSYRKISYTVTSSAISPQDIQSGGIAGEDNATQVEFNVSAITLGEDDYIRIEASKGNGEFYSSEHLTVANNRVSYMLPYEITSAGGIAVLHLVITTKAANGDRVIRYSFPARIAFDDAKVGGYNYDRYKNDLSGLAAEVKANAETVQALADDMNNAIAEHNESGTAHSDIRGALGDKATHTELTATVNGKINIHNTDNAAHSDIRALITDLSDYVQEIADFVGYVRPKTYRYTTVWNVSDFATNPDWYNAVVLGTEVRRTYGGSYGNYTLEVETEDGASSLKFTSGASYGKDSIFLNLARSGVDLSGSVGLRVKLKRSVDRIFSLGVSSNSLRYWDSTYGSDLSTLGTDGVAPAYIMTKSYYNGAAYTTSTDYEYYYITWDINHELKPSESVLQFRSCAPGPSGNNYMSNWNARGGYDSESGKLTDNFISSIESLYILCGAGSSTAGDVMNIMSVEAIFEE